MAKITNICKNCGKEFHSYWPEGYREFCCIGCEIDYKSDKDLKMTYKVGIIGHNQEFFSDFESVKNKIKYIIDLLLFQYQDIEFNLIGDTGVGLWSAIYCKDNNIKYNLYLYEEPQMVSRHWFQEQKNDLLNCCSAARSIIVGGKDLETTSENIIDNSSFLVAFWLGKKQGKTFGIINKALCKNKIIINGLNDLKLILAEKA